MSPITLRHSILVAWVALGVAACSHGPEGTTVSTTSPQKPYTGPPTPCDRELSVRDVAPIVLTPVSVNHYSMSAQMPGEGCELGNGNAMVDFSMRPGDAQLYALLSSGEKNALPLAGVGEAAVRTEVFDSNIPNWRETDILARKGGLICTVQLHFEKSPAGEKAVTPMRGEALSAALGQLCNRVYAGRG